MKKFYFILLIISVFAHAQVTLSVSSIPANTPEGDPIFAVGSFNNWNPSDPDFQLTEDNGVWSVVIPEGSGVVEYKFTRGDWSKVEGNEDGGFIPNRTFTFTGSAQTLVLSILSWEDLGGTGSESTAAWNVEIMDESFYIPQLDRNRKIWIYLPPDYHTSTKTYPVIYMQDGQNLFDNLTAFAGEWNVDETLNDLFNAGDYGAIVIGIENGQGERINEYSPWDNADYGGGDGDLYLQFMEETLKPYVDANYRTKPEAQYTAIIGSSMGALISTYAGLSSSSSFGKIGAMSPSYWFAYDDMLTYISSSTMDYSQSRVYFVGSSNESATLASNIEAVKNAWQAKGLTQSNTMVKIDDYGGHNEEYWSGEFSAAYAWLFMNENLNISDVNTKGQIKLYYKNNQLFVSGLETTEKVILFNSNGQKLANLILNNGWNSMNKDLIKGVYFIKGDKTSYKFLAR